MSRFARRVDANQSDIVDALRKIPGVTVEPGHDDILVGRNGVTYWFEIKSPDKVKKSGGLAAGALKPSQEKLLETYTGHYAVVWSLEQILAEMGIVKP